MTFHIIYPEDRLVSDEMMLMWGLDAYENKEIGEAPKNAQQAALLLEDAGFITLCESDPEG